MFFFVDTCKYVCTYICIIVFSSTRGGDILIFSENI